MIGREQMCKYIFEVGRYFCIVKVSVIIFSFRETIEVALSIGYPVNEANQVDGNQIGNIHHFYWV